MELSILTHPEFGEVRTTFDDKGTILFCATDVAKALGYSNQNDAISRHCNGIVKHDTITKTRGTQKLSYIYEPDVYRLVSRSKLPIALAFEKWIFETVLPSLRRDGFYAEKELIQDPDFLIRLGKLGEQLKREELEKQGLQQEVQYLTEVVADYEPKITYLEQILNSDNCMNTTNIAADYNISAIRLNKILHEERIQRRVGNQWVLYVDYMHSGLTQSETVLLGDGKKSVVHTKWTQQGRLLIHRILAKRGFQAE